MKLHEYQAKQLFGRFGIPVPVGVMITTAAGAPAAAAKIGTAKVVVKAQVLVGGRGKAGGVKLAAPDQVEAVASQILGMDIKGLTVKKVLIDPAIDIKEEYYVSFTLDRASKRHVLIASAAGGVDIEEVHATTPEKIAQYIIDPLVGLRDYHIRQVLKDGGFPAAIHGQTASIIKQLYLLFLSCDCNLAEINPLVVTGAGDVIAADAKIDIDENALFRQSELAAMADPDEETPNEAKAKAAGLTFIELDGSIGCVVNGAGLAMATMDMVNHFGGKAANFLDIGGSSNPQKVTAAMEVLVANPEIKSILFNIFGGITRCDDVARGLVTALKQAPTTLPLVIRLTGTNEAEGREILKEAGLTAVSSMVDAVKEAIRSAGEPVLAGR
ncbi:MAG: ADP-forming succinate--CoA ligase subunit beta [Candidatus Sericytochromatia bacterium]|nr:ADP-forming succinate--CoA ligase subunit beta [Candidatus Sericytochromatia bacterium]